MYPIPSSPSKFSMANRFPRVALIVVVESDKKPPVLLIDVERTGVVALSVQLLCFKKYEFLIETNRVFLFL